MSYYPSTSAGDVPARNTPLSWSRTVAREMVHRTSAAEVLLTDVRSLGGGGFEAAACWPRSHPTFPCDGGSRHNPLVLVETLRQLGIYLPLRYFRVPRSAHLILTDLFFEISPDHEPEAGYGATDITCRIDVPGVRSGADGAATGLRLNVVFLTGGTVFAQGGGGVRFLSEQRYAALRGPGHARRPPAPVPGLARPAASALAVAGARDVLIGRQGGATVVGPADPRHPFFFDHVTDHVPGMVLLEAVRQAAVVASRGALLRPRAARLIATHFTEFAPPARLVCVPHHRTCVFGVLQGGTRTTFGVLKYR
ncbi:ScbA/BarX family gamma-butyrolactone biosynthesis protein [Streptomyces sp.]|uniref:ScbA/BarX family gamma-butyrolactone biosynthesis protein n=1 Tax=Streptomyces sp. TaxID=1931 RepID=UPI002F41B706